MLSIVIPSEPSDLLLPASIRSLAGSDDLEIIVVELAEAASRAERMNLGFHRSNGEIILFHHPRSLIEPSGIKYLIHLSRENYQTPFWGGFTHQFDVEHPLLRFTSWYSNKIRAKRGIVYLDHGIFFDRKMWRRDLPPVDIFEDTLLSAEFRRVCAPQILPQISQTSSIRFQKNGIIKQSLMNQLMKIGFHLKVPHRTMNRFYEKGLELNTRYRVERTP